MGDMGMYGGDGAGPLRDELPEAGVRPGAMSRLRLLPGGGLLNGDFIDRYEK